MPDSSPSARDQEQSPTACEQPQQAAARYYARAHDINVEALRAIGDAIRGGSPPSAELLYLAEQLCDLNVALRDNARELARAAEPGQVAAEAFEAGIAFADERAGRRTAPAAAPAEGQGRHARQRRPRRWLKAVPVIVPALAATAKMMRRKAAAAAVAGTVAVAGTAAVAALVPYTSRPPAAARLAQGSPAADLSADGPGGTATSPAATGTPTATPTATPVTSPTVTSSPPSTVPPTVTPSGCPTVTPSPSGTPTSTPSPTVSPSPSPSPTPTAPSPRPRHRHSHHHGHHHRRGLGRAAGRQATGRGRPPR